MNIVIAILLLVGFQDGAGQLESVIEPTPIVAGPLDNLFDRLEKRFADRDRYLADLFQESERRQAGRIGQLVDQAVDRIQERREASDAEFAAKLERILERFRDRDPGDVGPIRERLQTIAGKLNDAVESYKTATSNVGPIRDLISRITWLVFALALLFVAFIVHGGLKKAGLI